MLVRAEIPVNDAVLRLRAERNVEEIVDFERKARLEAEIAARRAQKVVDETRCQCRRERDALRPVFVSRGRFRVGEIQRIRLEFLVVAGI